MPLKDKLPVMSLFKSPMARQSPHIISRDLKNCIENKCVSIVLFKIHFNNRLKLTYGYDIVPACTNNKQLYFEVRQSKKANYLDLHKIK